MECMWQVGTNSFLAHLDGNWVCPAGAKMHLLRLRFSAAYGLRPLWRPLQIRRGTACMLLGILHCCQMACTFALRPTQSSGPTKPVDPRYDVCSQSMCSTHRVECVFLKPVRQAPYSALKSCRLTRSCIFCKRLCIALCRHSWQPTPQQ